jgi:hypothetical protein
MKVVEEYPNARITHEFEEMTREKRPQDDPARNGKGLRFLSLEHGGEYPDPIQALKITNGDRRRVDPPHRSRGSSPAFMCRSRLRTAWWTARVQLGQG